MTHIFELKGTWMGGVSGKGDFQTRSIGSRLSVPQAFGGAGSGTNPEDLILSAASSSFLMTLGIALGHRKVEFSSIRLRSFVELETDGRNLRLTRIRHMPIVFIESGELSDALAAVAAAERNCLVANALKGNVEVTVRARVESAVEQP